MPAKYPDLDKESAKEIISIFNGVADEIAIELKRANRFTRNLSGVLAGSFYEVEEKDKQRSANARKFMSARICNGQSEWLTYSVECQQGGTTGYADVVTIIATSEIKIAPVVFLPDGEVDVNAVENYDIRHLSTYTKKTLCTESNGVQTNRRGVIGELKNLDAKSIANALITARVNDQTAERIHTVTNPLAHTFRMAKWTHPTGYGWKNEGKAIGSIGKVKA